MSSWGRSRISVMKKVILLSVRSVTVAAIWILNTIVRLMEGLIKRKRTVPTVMALAKLRS